MKVKKTAAIIMLFCLMTGLASEISAVGYPDVERSDWYYEAVTSLSESAIIDGYPDGSFYPEKTLTAAHFLKMISNAMYPDTLSGSLSWDRAAYYAALEKGIIMTSDIAEGQINQPICRYNAALIAGRVLDKVLNETVDVPDGMAGYIKDSFKIPAYYKDFIYKAYSAGILGGYSDGTFKGEEGLSRAEGAQIVLRLINKQKRLVIDSAKLSATVDDKWFSDAMFIGDSLTHGLSLYSGLKTPKYYYSTGVSLYSVETVQLETPSGQYCKLPDALKNNKFGKIYILLGINQLGSNRDSYYTDYADLIDLIRQYQKDAVIYLQSLLPVSRAKDAGSTVFTKERVLLFNEAIKKLAEDKNAVYVDIYSAFADEDGFLPENETWDGVHLNSNQYKIWVDYLKTHT
jgi:hypothetical protein